MEAHLKSRKGKGYRKEIIEFNLKQEEYIMWLQEQLQTKKYKHGGYTTFYVTEPKLRKIEKSRYIDRIVHRWLVDKLHEIQKFLRENLKLELNKKTQIFKSKQGVNFCGYKINEYRLKIRDKGKRKLKKKVTTLKHKIKQGKMTSKEAKKILSRTHGLYTNS